MYTWEVEYLDLVDHILRDGDDRVDRTGVGTRAIFGYTMNILLEEGFPAMTTKKLAWNALRAELLWFLEGTSDERRLAEIQHGTRDPEKKTIWTANAESDYWKPKAKFDGDLGRVYGVQWRRWRKFEMGEEPGTYYEGTEIDQVRSLVDKLKNNPADRRMIISAWNVGELDQMALPPCHMHAQFFVAKGQLSCAMYQRSVDVMLGLPFNIASYALLTHMLAHVTGLKAGELILNLGDTHIYNNHFEGAREQLERDPYDPPHLILNDRVTDIDGFEMSDITLTDYKSYDAIKMDMAV